MNYRYVLPYLYFTVATIRTYVDSVLLWTMGSSIRSSPQLWADEPRAIRLQLPKETPLEWKSYEFVETAYTCRRVTKPNHAGHEY
jgi:hypothetical protein